MHIIFKFICWPQNFQVFQVFLLNPFACHFAEQSPYKYMLQFNRFKKATHTHTHKHTNTQHKLLYKRKVYESMHGI